MNDDVKIKPKEVRDDDWVAFIPAIEVQALENICRNIQQVSDWLQYEVIHSKQELSG